MKKISPILSVLALLSACSTTPEAMRSKKALVDRVFNEVWSRGQLAVTDQTLHADFTYQVNGETTKGRANYRQFIEMYRAAFPDLTFEVEHVATEDDRVVVRWVSRGTHTGKLGDLPPTNKRIAVHGITITQVRDGKAIAEWTTWDEHGFLEQLGVIQGG